MVLRVTKQQADIIAPYTGSVTLLSAGTGQTPFFRANWRNPVEVSTTWLTAVSRSQETGAGTRVSLAERPIRTIKATLTGMTQEQSVMLQMSLQQMGRFGIPFPIYPDVTKLDTTLTTIATTVEADIRYKRFYPGQRVVFVEPGFNRQNYGALGTGIYGEIVDVYDNGFSIVDALDFEIPAGYDIFPLIDIHPNLNIKTKQYTDNNVEVKITAIEQSGQSTLPPSWRGTPNVPVYKTFPVFLINPNYNSNVSTDYRRHGQRYKQGRDSVINTHSVLPYIAWKFNELSLTKAQAWDYLNFFDSRRGRNKVFWIIQPQTNWNIIALTTTYVDVADFDYMQNMIDLVEHIGFDTGDIRTVSTVTTPSAGVFRFTFEDPFSVAPTATYCTPAYLSTFVKDTFTEIWTTDLIYTTKFEVQQELQNKDATVAGL